MASIGSCDNPCPNYGDSGWPGLGLFPSPGMREGVESVHSDRAWRGVLQRKTAPRSPGEGVTAGQATTTAAHAIAARLERAKESRLCFKEERGIFLSCPPPRSILQPFWSSRGCIHHLHLFAFQLPSDAANGRPGCRSKSRGETGWRCLFPAPLALSPPFCPGLHLLLLQ